MGESEHPGPESKKPQRTAKTMTLAVMAVTALAAGLLALSLRHEAIYALGEHQAMLFGGAFSAFDGGELAPHANKYVRAEVSLEEPAAKFRRPLEKAHYRVAKAGDNHWVVYAMPDGYAENRFIPPRLVAGRLSRASELGARFSGVADTTGSDAWVLVDGDAPYGGTWLLGLEALLLGFVLFNLGGILRVARPVR